MFSLSPLSRRYFVTIKSIVTLEEIGRQIWSKTVILPVNNIVKQIKIISKYFGYALVKLGISILYYLFMWDER